MTTEQPDPVPPNADPGVPPGYAPAAARPQRPWVLPLITGLAGIAIGAASMGILQSGALSGDSRLADAAEYCTDDGTGDGLRLGDGGRTLTVDTAGEDDADGTDVVYGLCVLSQLDVPDSVMSRIQQTTSLDGQQSGSWDGLTATWTYHPSRGLDFVITVD